MSEDTELSSLLLLFDVELPLLLFEVALPVEFPSDVELSDEVSLPEEVELDTLSADVALLSYATGLEKDGKTIPANASGGSKGESITNTI